jgi:hypothetical protein
MRVQFIQRHNVRRVLAAAGLAVCALMAAPRAGLGQGPPFLCNVKEVAIFPRSTTGGPHGRFHVRCDPGFGTPPNIGFFAYPLDDNDTSSLLSLAASAVAAHRTLAISGAEDRTLCDPVNCHKITVLFLID